MRVRIRFIVCIFWLWAWPQAFAQTCSAPGVQGPCNITTPNTVLNSYHAGAGTVIAGASQVGVAAVAGQRSNTRTLKAGDLVVIMQMQDSTAPGNAGLYEYASIVSITGTTLILNRPLTNGYVQSMTTVGPTVRTFQVIFVPQCSALTVAAGGSIFADRWTIGIGSGQGTGGVLVLDSASSVAINGTVSVAGAGFRGGSGRQGTGNRAGTATFADLNQFAGTVTTSINGGLKGEGIGGLPSLVLSGSTTIPNGGLPATLNYYALTREGHPLGGAGRGAIGNAGGGGNDGLPLSGLNGQNSGGGGGGNHGSGGNGGNSWNSDNYASTTLNNPTTTTGLGLGGNPAGGQGGLVQTNSSGRAVMGGGGGAGAANNSATPANAYTAYPPVYTNVVANGAVGATAASGAAGGGVVLIRGGAFSASGGVIQASGYNAYNMGGAGQTDSAGGGGAGGTVLIHTLSGAGAGLTVNALGGGGGSSNYRNHGPGGGGGGGYVEMSFAGATVNVGAGSPGVDVCCGGTAGNLSPKAYNASAGGVGASVSPGGTPVGTSAGPSCLPQLQVAKSTTTPLRIVPANTTAQYVINVTNPITAGAAYGVSVQDVLPSPFRLSALLSAATTTFSGTNTTGPTPTTTNRSGNTTTAVFGAAGSANGPASTTPSFTIFPGGSVTVTFNVNLGTTTFGTYQNAATVTFTDPTRTTGGAATGTNTINAVVSPGGIYAAGAAVGGGNYASTLTTFEDVKLVQGTTSLAITKTNFVGTVEAGQTTGYTITVTNSNPGTVVASSTLADLVSAGLSCTAVVCAVVSGTATCPAIGAGAGQLSIANLLQPPGAGVVIPSLGVGTTMSFTVTCGVTATGF